MERQQLDHGSGGNVTGNNKVWRKFTFSPITTSKIRVTINQVPDSWSRVVEIQAFGTSAGGEKVQWLVPDHLGTPRIIVDQTGSLANVKSHDYLPFGEEMFAGTASRTVGQGYAADGVRQQFTSKERDVETGLDYFLARYYSSEQGRFTSPDEFTGGPAQLYTFAGDASANPTFYADLKEPQSLNKYQYTYNNPLRYTDPTGAVAARDSRPANTTMDDCRSCRDLSRFGPYGERDVLSRLSSRTQDNSGNGQDPQGQRQSNTAVQIRTTPVKSPCSERVGHKRLAQQWARARAGASTSKIQILGNDLGKIHYQSGDKKYLYDANTKSFVGASKTENKRLLGDAQVQRAIKKGLKVLGEN